MEAASAQGAEKSCLTILLFVSNVEIEFYNGTKAVMFPFC